MTSSGASFMKIIATLILTLTVFPKPHCWHIFRWFFSFIGKKKRTVHISSLCEYRYSNIGYCVTRATDKSLNWKAKHYTMFRTISNFLLKSSKDKRFFNHKGKEGNYSLINVIVCFGKATYSPSLISASLQRSFGVKFCFYFVLAFTIFN
jgi:hypothetical protein